MKNKYVKNVVVLKVETHPGQSSLAAYILQNGDVDDALIEKEVRQTCEAELLKFMVPSYFIVLKEFPLNQNRKIDHSLLPLPVFKPQMIQEPQNDLEKNLRNLWSIVLGIPEKDISTESNFFDIGGNSLLSTKLISLIRRDIDHQVSIQDIFQFQTIRSFVSSLQNHLSITESQIPKLNLSSGLKCPNQIIFGLPNCPKQNSVQSPICFQD
jgi:acyl carrier protein